MTKLHTLFLLLALTATQAYAAPLQIQKLTYAGKLEQGQQADKDQITMPLVISTPASPIADTVLARINDNLFISQFTALAPRKSSGTLTAADKLVLTGTGNQSYKITRNDGHILTVAFDGESCGAYCEGYATAYSFDVRDGALLTAANLFTPAGMQALDTRMTKERQARYRKQIADIQAAQKKPGAKNKPAVDDDDEDRLALNRDCLESASVVKSPADQRRDFTGYNYELSAKSFILTAGRCSNHASRALDDVDSVSLVLPYAAMAPYLSTYGKALLLDDTSAQPGQPAPPMPDRFDKQVLRGVMATGGAGTPITVLMSRNDDNSVGGNYFYDRVRKPIALTGTDNKGKLELQEFVGDTASPKARFILQRAGSALSGEWVDAGGKHIPVRLSP